MENSQNQKIAPTAKVKDGSQIDRVILGKNEAEILSKWADDFNKNADGLVKVSKADLVNYLIASHATKLTHDEIREIAARCYDETRWLSWSMTKMKSAKKSGVSLLFDELMKFRDEFLGKSAIFRKKKSSSGSIQETSNDGSI